MRRLSLILFTLLLTFQMAAQDRTEFVENLLWRMTLEEKLGQLTMIDLSGVDLSDQAQWEKIELDFRYGKIGFIYGVKSRETANELQRMAVENRLKVPVIFVNDIPANTVTFPLPISMTASWDVYQIEKEVAHKISPLRNTATHMVLQPLANLAVNPLWDKIPYTYGENPFLVSRAVETAVHTIQRDSLSFPESLMATARFAFDEGYLPSREIPYRELMDYHLAPFRAAIDTNVTAIQTGNALVNKVPASTLTQLNRLIFKGIMGFTGFTLGAPGTVPGLLTAKYAKDTTEAVVKAINGGTDVDFNSRMYVDSAKKAILAGKIDGRFIDEAVRSILKAKQAKGLFNDKELYFNIDSVPPKPNLVVERTAARSAGARNIVLLKNADYRGRSILPLEQVRRIALIGPYIKAGRENLGALSGNAESETVTQYDGISAQRGSIQLSYARGSAFSGTDRSGFNEAVRAANNSDVVILSLGEDLSKSPAGDMKLPAIQEQLFEAVAATGKPVIVLVNASRPLVLDAVSRRATAVLYTWHLGSQAGNAIADVLLGKINPAAKMPFMLPANASDPYFTPYSNTKPNSLFAFGHGLSYTEFSLANITVNKQTMVLRADTLTIRVDVQNTGKIAGEEVIQLYSHVPQSEVVRPWRELIAFRKVFLTPGQRVTLTFTFNTDDFKFIGKSGKYITEPGIIEFYLGNSSDAPLAGKVDFVETADQ